MQKNLCQNGYVWVTMVIEHALFCLSLQSGPLVGLQRLTAVRGCGSGLGFLTKCPNYSINTPNVAKHPVCYVRTQLSAEQDYFNILIQVDLSFWKSHVCANKLDVQKTDLSFTQLNRIRNHFLGRRIEIRRAACSRVMGFDCFCSWKHNSDSRETGRPAYLSWCRFPTMRHVSRTQRVALDWLFDRINLDPKSKSVTMTPNINSQTF